MAIPNGNPARNSSFLYPYKDSQTKPGRKARSGCDSLTEQISPFVDYLHQPIAKVQESYLKDTTDFLNFIEKTKVAKSILLVSMDVTSLYMY